MSSKIKNMSAEVKTHGVVSGHSGAVNRVARALAGLTGLAVIIAMVVACGGKNESPAPSTSTSAAATGGDLAAAAQDAYTYAYPLVTMEYTRRVLTNTVEPQGTAAPMGQFVRMREYPNAQFRAVTAPNADTLYTQAWFDVAKEPWIVSVPDMGDRYFLLPMLDGWTEVFASPGKRTTGGKAQTFAITGPGWSGTLPPGVTEYKSATAMVWLLGRIFCTGTPEDYAAVHALQDQITAVPLSAYGKPYTAAPGVVDPAVDTKIAVREQVNALSGADYFRTFADLLKTNPPTAADAPTVQTLAKLGIVPGQAFDATKLDPGVASAIADAPKAAQGKIMAWAKDGIAAGDNTFQNGWLFTTKTGTYGTNYLQRAYITAIGLGANLPQDAVYPTSEGPSQQVKYNGANKYVMHFDKGQLPPVKGFWSLTMYDADYFFVDNPLNRYTLSQRDNLTTNPDGSVDLLIQADPPSDTANWLPAPKGDFVLMLRMYWPQETAPSIIDGTWKVPPVTQAP
ncbi:Uncharacterized conserved protein [Mycolicibacterium fluoranthenivorans]|jgi:hypothetical protein|uniref:Uncharacterized conserved protein n=2 Tax=Mycolicibacterium fluoranthenivorans TaxID=258505 RepID=A0A1G4V5G8_9MYCO|nr:Uncharacterized conserved protein [Mycolicibacterium fluoranthenivorans]